MIASSSVKGRLKPPSNFRQSLNWGREREKKQDVETNIWKTASLNYLVGNCTILKLRHETGKEKYSTGNNPDSF